MSGIGTTIWNFNPFPKATWCRETQAALWEHVKLADGNASLRVRCTTAAKAALSGLVLLFPVTIAFMPIESIAYRGLWQGLVWRGGAALWGYIWGAAPVPAPVVTAGALSDPQIQQVLNSDVGGRVIEARLQTIYNTQIPLLAQAMLGECLRNEPRFDRQNFAGMEQVISTFSEVIGTTLQHALRAHADKHSQEVSKIRGELLKTSKEFTTALQRERVLKTNLEQAKKQITDLEAQLATANGHRCLLTQQLTAAGMAPSYILPEIVP